MVDRRPSPRGRSAALATALAVTTAGVVAGTGSAVGGSAWETGSDGVSRAEALLVPPDSSAAGAPAAFNPNGITISLQEVASGFNQPVFVTGAGDGSGRLFVVEQGGLVRIVKNGSILPTPFLDLSTVVSTGGERGLLGLAFHRSFATNHKLYVNFTQANGATAINEYRVTTNPDRVGNRTGRRLLTIGQPYPNHNGGMLAFAPDGYLYIGMGDGGSGGDPQNRAQSLSSLLGKILRIDINGRGTYPYLIPRSNPYVEHFGLDQIWARGLRNPWRFSFDAMTGDLWIGDVGQDRYEEIDRSLAPARGRAANYGWRLLEGRHCYRPATGCSATGKVRPIVEYSHAEGCSVTGGYVYRGKAQPILQGAYFFSDFCSGTIWTIAANAASPATKVALLDSGLNISSFGQDDAKELYVVDHSGGKIYRIVGAAK